MSEVDLFTLPLWFQFFGILISLVEAIDGIASPDKYGKERKIYAVCYLLVALFPSLFFGPLFLVFTIPYFFLALHLFASPVKEKPEPHRIPSEIVWIPLVFFGLLYIPPVIFEGRPPGASSGFFGGLVGIVLLLSSLWLLHGYIRARLWFAASYILVSILAFMIFSPIPPLLSLGLHGLAETGLSKMTRVRMNLRWRWGIVKCLVALLILTVVFYVTSVVSSMPTESSRRQKIIDFLDAKIKSLQGNVRISEPSWYVFDLNQFLVILKDLGILNVVNRTAVEEFALKNLFDSVHMSVQLLWIIDALDKVNTERVAEFILSKQMQDGRFSNITLTTDFFDTISAVGTLHILDELDRINKTQVGLWILNRSQYHSVTGDLYYETGVWWGYLANTHGAIAALARLDLLSFINRTKVIQMVSMLQHPSGGFAARPLSPPPRFVTDGVLSPGIVNTYNVLGILSLLNALDTLDMDRTLSWILRVQNPDGGFGYGEGAWYSDIYHTFYVVESLSTLGKLSALEEKMPKLVRWQAEMILDTEYRFLFPAAIVYVLASILHVDERIEDKTAKLSEEK